LQEFWMTGDNNGRWAGDANWPTDHALYAECAADVVRMLRSHPSLLLWCGGNELYPAAKSPAPDVAVALRDTVRRLDGTRPYLPSSMDNYTHTVGHALDW
jgi:beta-galactosidase/beta-glucuronidase